MTLPFSKLKDYRDVSVWVSSERLSFEDVCRNKFDLDVSNDVRNAFIYYIVTNETVEITDQHLELCGYTGKEKLTLFLSLIEEDTDMPWPVTKNKHSIEMNNDHFGFLLMKMDTEKALEYRQLYWFFKSIEIQYLKYEKLYEERDTRNTKAAAIRKNRSISTDVIDPLRKEVAPLVSPEPVKSGNERWMLLFNLNPEAEKSKKWHIMRIQKRRYEQSKRELLAKYPSAREVRRWKDLSHSVDVFNLIKHSDTFSNPAWTKSNNILEQTKEEKKLGWYTDEDLVKAMDNLILRNLDTNPAAVIAEKAETIIQ